MVRFCGIFFSQYVLLTKSCCRSKFDTRNYNTEILMKSPRLSPYLNTLALLFSCKRKKVRVGRGMLKENMCGFFVLISLLFVVVRTRQKQNTSCRGESEFSFSWSSPLLQMHLQVGNVTNWTVISNSVFQNTAHTSPPTPQLLPPTPKKKPNQNPNQTKPQTPSKNPDQPLRQHPLFSLRLQACCLT